MRTIYLDFNATTPLAPSVQEGMLPFLAEHYGNASSTHALGRACHEAILEARGRVAELIGCESDEIVFTSGGTEANNAALKGVCFHRRRKVDGGHLVITSLEHPAIVEPAKFLERLGYELTVVSCGRSGVVDPGDIEDALRPDTLLVSVMHANNEIGTVQPIQDISKICRDRDVLLHTDAAQTCGKLPVDVDELGVDLLSMAGHKFYGPKGVGALYVRRGTALEPLLHGAGHEGGQRAGTENIAYIVGLGRAASLVSQSMGEAPQRMRMLRDRLHSRLYEAIGDRLTVNGTGSDRLPNTLSVNFPGIVGGELLQRLPELCASTAAACHSGSTTLSPTQRAIGLDEVTARGTIRFSVGWYTSEEDIDRAANWIIDAWESLRPA